MPVAAFCSEQPGASMYLWRLINAARVYPLRAIESLGIDEETARQVLGEDAWILDQGLPPLAWNDSLFQAASGHNQDMVAQLYYSSTGLDGSSIADRIAAQGYDAVGSDELLGVMAFDAVIESLEAARMLFENWLQDELNPANTSARRIFSRVFTEVGFSFKSAVLDLGEDIPHNVYVAVTDFACPRVPVAYLIGNVYQDDNGNGCWEPAEGLSGVGLALRDVILDDSDFFTSGPLGAYQVAVSGIVFTVAVVDVQGMPIGADSFSDTAFGWWENRLADFRLQ
ncbi:MAG: CAP domain-containing protein [Desulfobulbaceae bacterium]|nr:CAP domain-containing protein [Desulfobulbaceae bacterium]